MAFHRGSVMRLWKVSRAIRKSADWQRSAAGSEFWKTTFGRQEFKIDSFRTSAQAIGEPRLREAVVGLLELEVWAKSGSSEPFRYYEWLWKITNRGAVSAEPAFLVRS
jgi:hypothetical protein